MLLPNPNGGLGTVICWGSQRDNCEVTGSSVAGAVEKGDSGHNKLVELLDLC